IGRSQPLPLSGLRIVAGLVALGGLTVAVVGGGAVDASTWTVVGIGVALFGGGIILTIQSAGTGQVTLETGNPLIATLASSLGGFLGISVIAAIAWIGGAFDGATLPGWDEWWLYLGGPMGAVIVILTAWAVPRLGVFLLTLSVVGGQMLVSILLDVQRHGVSWFTVAAAVITCAAVGLAMPRNKVAGSA
ncbi:MAG: DMT family transporter, partial [Promicromonosporaceae bacterium]|nr:DMT family transporter [Promicromonosporaceae bacterium]